MDDKKDIIIQKESTSQSATMEWLLQWSEGECISILDQKAIGIAEIMK